MTRKVYRTAQGKMVDLGALQLRNETVRSVGNMKVNARGDLIDSNNRAINSRNQQVDRQYRRQTSNVSNTPVQHARTAAAAADIPTPPEDFQDDFVKPTDTAPTATSHHSPACLERYSIGQRHAVQRSPTQFRNHPAW